MPPLSRALSELLDATGSPDEACRQIISDPGLLNEVKAALPALKEVAETMAGREGVMAVISRRFAIYPQPQRSAEEWDAWWADYFDVLADQPLASLEAGMRAWVARPESEFMPKPGQLRELAFTSPSRSLGRYYRAKRAIQLAEEKPLLTGPRVNPTDVRAMLADFNAKMGAGRSDQAKAPLPSISGKVDETGITPELRKVIERQRAERMAAE